MAGNRFRRAAVGAGAGLWLATFLVHAQTPAATAPQVAPPPHTLPAAIFETSDRCIACHNGLITSTGQDVSMAADWQTSMMANSARDPYWQAAVRREVMDHPAAQAAIEDECTICHMPMTTFAARAGGLKGRLFDRLPIGNPNDPDAALAADGVSCTVCHQLSPTRLGDPSTFTGGYVLDIGGEPDARRIYGPFTVDEGRTAVMRSAAGFTPVEGTHLQQSEACASCHTLFTHALAPGAGEVRLPEQTPYLEWQQSAYRTTASCQTCHMPALTEDTPIASVLGQPRPALSRHTFLGGNFFMQRMLGRYRDELGVAVSARDMDAAAARTIAHLRESTARVSIANATRQAGRIDLVVLVENLAGHKFPTAYPSRRAWLQVTARDAAGRPLFESGAFLPDGRIAGNDHDANPATFEPHHDLITRADQVQVYESIMGGPDGQPTTGLLTGSRYLKDNRLLPSGFRKASATPETAVQGAAAADGDFDDARDLVRYQFDASAAATAVTIEIKMWFQPIGYRWAENLRGYRAPEPERFMRYWDAMAGGSATVIAETRASVR
jgi:hypothetical protein